MEIRPGEEIVYGDGRRFRVLDVVPFEKDDASLFVGMLRVEAVSDRRSLSSRLREEREGRCDRGLHLGHPCEARGKPIVGSRKGGRSRMAQTPETYTRTISTMSEVLDELRHGPDPDGTLTALADRIAVDRECVRVLLALGEEPRRPPGWSRQVATPIR